LAIWQRRALIFQVKWTFPSGAGNTGNEVAKGNGLLKWIETILKNVATRLVIIVYSIMNVSVFTVSHTTIRSFQCVDNRNFGN
jgi:hypothetical protein